jgi:hypothetical protein
MRSGTHVVKGSAKVRFPDAPPPTLTKDRTMIQRRRFVLAVPAVALALAARTASAQAAKLEDVSAQGWCAAWVKKA